MAIRLMTYLTSATQLRPRSPATTGDTGFPHVGECGFAGAVRSQRSDGMRIVKESNGGRVSAAGEAM